LYPKIEPAIIHFNQHKTGLKRNHGSPHSSA
jgi:hypothetical protein